MNFSEGSRRVYIVFTVLGAIGFVGSRWGEFPGSARNVEIAQRLYIEQLKEATTVGLRRTQPQLFDDGEIDWNGVDKQPGFVNDICSGKLLPQHKDGTKVARLLEVDSVCASHKNITADLPWQKAKFIGETLVGTLAIGVAALMFWLILAWIGRGFHLSKTLPPPQ